MKVNPEILVWARKTAGLSLDEAARKLGFNDTRQRSATERLEALENGDEEPSRSVLVKMTDAYRRSLLIFYMAVPPRTGDRGQDFRTIPGAKSPQYNPVLDALIRDLRGRQSIVRTVVEGDDIAPRDFIGAASMSSISPQALAQVIVQRLQFSLNDYRAQRTQEQAFDYLRQKIEAAGIYVLLLGNLGSHHTNIPVEVFRGFAIADPLAPFIVINDQDAKPAWSFTVLHEVAHLWLGATGVSGTSIEAQIEKYCNDVASEILLPAGEIQNLRQLRSFNLNDSVDAISAFAKARKISRTMVAYCLFRSDFISDRAWHQLTDHFDKQWAARRSQESDRDRDGGPSFYVVRRHRLGNALLDLVRRSLGEGALTHTKAGQVLGVKPRNVDPLLHGVSLQGSR